jgi:hypothetical protein
MLERYYINDLKTTLIKRKENSVYVYNFIERNWKKSEYWEEKILFEGAVDCIEIKKNIANKIINGEQYAIN